jgi:8-oxo-dGTP pyrophosphatase MutT (NUDIX family)
MYEVFLNDRKIIIAGESALHLIRSNAERIQNPDTKTLIHKTIAFLAGSFDEIVFLGDTGNLWHTFQGLFSLLPAAGGIVHRDNALLFIFRRGKWDLPKGKIESGESPEMAALREVSEETGLTGLFTDGMFPSTWHVYQSKYKGSEGTWILKETKWFSMQFTGDSPLVPETCEDIEQARWFAPDNLGEVLANTYSSLIQLIELISLDRNNPIRGNKTG